MKSHYEIRLQKAGIKTFILGHIYTRERIIFFMYNKNKHGNIIIEVVVFGTMQSLLMKRMDIKTVYMGKILQIDFYNRK